MSEQLNWPSVSRAMGPAPKAELADLSALASIVRSSIAPEYELVEEVGRGGMAIVFLARERATGRQLAVKVLRQDLRTDDEARARLSLEASVIARIDHPNVMRIHGVRSLADGSAALLLDFAPGGTLKQRLRANQGQLAPQEVARVLEHLAGALAAVHEHAVVHRDLKPDNVFFGQDDQILLGDFGIARAPVDENLTHDGATLGTPTYMSPEQLDGRPVGPPADIYAYGLIAYELLGGRQPWAGESLWSIVHKQKSEQLPDAARTLSRIGDPVQAIALHQCISKDAASRPQSGSELLEAMGWSGIDQDDARPAPVLPSEHEHTVRLSYRADTVDPLVRDAVRTTVEEKAVPLPVVAQNDATAVRGSATPAGALRAQVPQPSYGWAIGLTALGITLLAGMGALISSGRTVARRQAAAPSAQSTTTGQPSLTPSAQTAQFLPPPAMDPTKKDSSAMAARTLEAAPRQRAAQQTRGDSTEFERLMARLTPSQRRQLRAIEDEFINLDTPSYASAFARLRTFPYSDNDRRALTSLLRLMCLADREDPTGDRTSVCSAAKDRP